LDLVLLQAVRIVVAQEYIVVAGSAQAVHIVEVEESEPVESQKILQATLPELQGPQAVTPEMAAELGVGIRLQVRELAPA
jgi:hypothetical protein